jgi:Protein of unknown function (DUF3619)
VNFVTPQRPHPSSDDLQARLALNLTARLSEQADHLPHDLAERLRVAREQAVERARQSRRLATAPALQVQASGTAVLSGPPSLWLRLASFLPLVVLAAGMVLIDQANLREEISAAAEIDAALLADDLPPAAYLDPGFSEFLKSPDGP